MDRRLHIRHGREGNQERKEVNRGSLATHPLKGEPMKINTSVMRTIMLISSIMAVGSTLLAINVSAQYAPYACTGTQGFYPISCTNTYQAVEQGVEQNNVIAAGALSNAGVSFTTIVEGVFVLTIVLAIFGRYILPLINGR